MDNECTYTVFVGMRCVASGQLAEILPALKSHPEHLVFEDASGRQVDFDLRGTVEEILARTLPVVEKAGPGRPKLGVVSREISLLPRHWAWLEAQPSGASAALRRLVDQARAEEEGPQRVRQAREAAGRFLTALAGNLSGYEEACRALWAGDREAMQRQMAEWPEDLRCYVQRLAWEGL